MMENAKEIINQIKDIEEKEERDAKIASFKKDELIELLVEAIGGTRKFKVGRKDEVKALLMTGNSYSVDEMSETIGISPKNISSQLTYLRKDGLEIGTRSNGKKYLENLAELTQ